MDNKANFWESAEFSKQGANEPIANEPQGSSKAFSDLVRERLAMDDIHLHGNNRSPAQSLAGGIQKLRRSIYTLSIDVFFNARHYVTSSSRRGDVHNHTFRVNVTTRQKLKPDTGYIFGFGDLRAIAEQEVQYFHNQLLNDLPTFSPDFEPITENLAAVLYQNIEQRLPPALTLESISLWESPTVRVTYSEESL